MSTNNVVALLEVLLIFGGALAFALHQLYQLRDPKPPAKKSPPSSPNPIKSIKDPPPPS